MSYILHLPNDALRNAVSFHSTYAVPLGVRQMLNSDRGIVFGRKMQLGRTLAALSPLTLVLAEVPSRSYLNKEARIPTVWAAACHSRCKP